MVQISDKEVIDLWKDPQFEGSFRGIKAFQTILKTNLNIDISENRLHNIFKNEPFYLIHQRRKIVKRRSYDLHGLGELLQADLGYMYTYKDFKYFLLVVDCYSSKLFVEPLKTRDSVTVANALERIIKSFKAQIYKLETDRGSEFFGAARKVFKKYGIYYKSKFGKHKANFVERMIYVVKRKLYLILRSQLTLDWVKYIKFVVDSYNNTPLKKLGYLTPNKITSEKNSVDVDLSKKEFGIASFKQPNFEEQELNVQSYNTQKNKLSEGDFCYKFYDEKLFEKKYNISVCLPNQRSFHKFYSEAAISKFSFDLRRS